MAHGHKVGVLQRYNPLLNIAIRVLDLFAVGAGLFIAVPQTQWGPGHITLLLIGLMAFLITVELDPYYVSWRSEPLRKEVQRVSTIWLIAFLVTNLLDSALPLGVLTRDPLITWFTASLLLLLAGRIFLRSLLRLLRRFGRNSRTIAIAGRGAAALQLAERISRSPWMGLRIHGFYDDSTHAAADTAPPACGDLDQLIEDTRRLRFDRVYLTLPMDATGQVDKLASALADTATEVYFVPNIFIFNLVHARVVDHAGIPAISIYETPLQDFNAIKKRLEDLILGSLFLALASLPMLLIAVAIKLTSPGPVFFRQTRYGLDGRPIKVWKFRTMTVMEDGTQVTQATRDDQRITPLGRLLRRTSLDELPQLLNAIDGSMSIVGPRPHAVAHNEMYRRLIPGYMLRHRVKPGITGLAQISGFRGETDTLEKMKGRVDLDLEYIRSWSLTLDLKIILRSALVGFSSPDAY